MNKVWIKNRQYIIDVIQEYQMYLILEKVSI